MAKELSSIITPQCPIRTTLDILGGKWRLVILSAVGEEALRLSEIRARIPTISEKMLVQDLTWLSDYHLVQRTVCTEKPRCIRYTLTDIGKNALPLIENIRDFGIYYQSAIRSA